MFKSFVCSILYVYVSDNFFYTERTLKVQILMIPRWPEVLKSEEVWEETDLRLWRSHRCSVNNISCYRWKKYIPSIHELFPKRQILCVVYVPSNLAEVMDIWESCELTRSNDKGEWYLYNKPLLRLSCLHDKILIQPLANKLKCLPECLISQPIE